MSNYIYMCVYNNNNNNNNIYSIYSYITKKFKIKFTVKKV